MDESPDLTFINTFNLIRKYDGKKMFKNKKEEIEFIERVYKLGLNFDNIRLFTSHIKYKCDKIAVENNCNFYINRILKKDFSEITFDILTNNYLSYENLCYILLNLTKIKTDHTLFFEYQAIYTNINNTKNAKMRRLMEYCFYFDIPEWNYNMWYPLTIERLTEFNAEYAIVERNDRIIEKINKLSDDKITMIEKYINEI